MATDFQYIPKEGSQAPRAHTHERLTTDQQFAVYAIREELTRHIYRMEADISTLGDSFWRGWNSGYCGWELVFRVQGGDKELRNILVRLAHAEHPQPDWPAVVNPDGTPTQFTIDFFHANGMDANVPDESCHDHPECDGTPNDGCANDPDLGTCSACGYVNHNIPQDADNAHDDLCCGDGAKRPEECTWLHGDPCVTHFAMLPPTVQRMQDGDR